MLNAPARPLLSCIADDFTGATDLANMLVRGGMRAAWTPLKCQRSKAAKWFSRAALRKQPMGK